MKPSLKPYFGTNEDLNKRLVSAFSPIIFYELGFKIKKSTPTDTESIAEVMGDDFNPLLHKLCDAIDKLYENLDYAEQLLKLYLSTPEGVEILKSNDLCKVLVFNGIMFAITPYSKKFYYLEKEYLFNILFKYNADEVIEFKQLNHTGTHTISMGQIGRTKINMILECLIKDYYEED